MSDLKTWPNQQTDDFTITDFQFASCEVLESLTLHYMTLGTPRRVAPLPFSRSRDDVPRRRVERRF